MSKKKGTDLSSLLSQGRKKFGTIQADDDSFDWMAQREALLRDALKESNTVAEAAEEPLVESMDSPALTTKKSSTRPRKSNATQDSHTLMPHKSVLSKEAAEDAFDKEINATQIGHTVKPHKKSNVSTINDLDFDERFNATQIDHTSIPHTNATQDSHTVKPHANATQKSTAKKDSDYDNDHNSDQSDGRNATQDSHTVKPHANATQINHTSHTLKPHNEHSKATHHTLMPHNGHTTATHNATQLTQNGHTLEIQDEVEIRHLTGHSLRLFEALVNLFLEKKIRTISVSKKMLSVLTNVPEGSVLTTTDRMRSRGFIQKEKIGRGKGAKLLISIPDHYFYEFINYRKGSNATQDSHTDSHTNGSSKLVSDISLTELTKSEAEENHFSEFYAGYEDIDLTSLQRVGISQKQLNDIRNQRLPLTAAQVETFVGKFAIFISEPENIRNVRNIKGLFVHMAQLEAKGQSPLSGIVTPEEEAINQLIKRKEQAREEKQKQFQRLFELTLEEWLDGLSLEQKNELAPPSPLVREGSESQKRLLREHFQENVWPTLKEQELTL